jgi:hypothetical protein
MDIFDEELLSFWRHLNSANVRYIMVGGVAANLHGYNRSTEDIDVWIEDTIENRSKFREAFRKYSGQDIVMMERMQLVPGWTPFELNNGFELDLMTSMKGLEGFTFEECLVKASVADIDEERVPFLHINHLIINKKAVNRPKDQLDVIYLEKILKLREEDKPQ